MKSRFSAAVMSITPFDQDGALDEGAFRLHLSRLREAGVRVYVGSSASGEGFSLRDDELDRVLAIAIDELAGRVPVRAMGCEVRDAGEMIAFLRRVERHPLDAVHIFAPEMGHAAKPTDAELARYYTSVVAATAQPVVLSSYQAFGFDVPVTLLESLVDRFPHIVGFFYGGSDGRYLSTVIERLAPRIEVHCAGPFNALATLALGGHGFMGHEGNLAPKLVASVVTAFETGDRERLHASYATLMALHRIHYRHGGPVRAMKPRLAAFGLPGGAVRLPRLARAGAELDAVIEATLRLRIAELPPQVARPAADR